MRISWFRIEFESIPRPSCHWIAFHLVYLFFYHSILLNNSFSPFFWLALPLIPSSLIFPSALRPTFSGFIIFCLLACFLFLFLPFSWLNWEFLVSNSNIVVRKKLLIIPITFYAYSTHEWEREGENFFTFQPFHL